MKKSETKVLEEIIKKKAGELNQEEWVELICKKCRFYHPEESKLECSGFKILKMLVFEGKISLSDIVQAAAKNATTERDG